MPCSPNHHSIGPALHFLEMLCFNQKNPQQLFSVCLYARLLELATACKVLLEKNAMVGIPILLRSMFEADIDLTNLMKCPDYYKRMYASFLKEKLRLTKEAASSRPNPFLTEIREDRNPKKDLCETQAELDQLIAENNGPIDIRHRAEFASKLDGYLSNYKSLCLDTHNNINSLEEWHIKKPELLWKKKNKISIDPLDRKIQGFFERHYTKSIFILEP
ncbi:MAG: DUF5677 domain-containing protein [Candidatus Jettenia sp. CY-1]|nr:DUF5677 domain-containing protein [Candidatus Jettenia sp.]WKZ17641.1 MAG: DUF5677 domain-containing protein [Candidatus Jettenia sp. CY-1]